MIRLFTAIPLPEALRRRLSMLTRGLREVRWVPEENLHLTLCFIGEVPTARLPDVVEAVQQVRGAAFSLHLAGCGHFESRGRPRAMGCSAWKWWPASEHVGWPR